MNAVNSILANIITTLQLPNGIAPYVNTITSNQVSMGPSTAEDLDRHITEMNIFPYFCVINGMDARSYDPSYAMNTCSFLILCTFSNETEAEMNTYIDDIETALSQDITRATVQCHESKIIRVTRDSYRLASQFRRWTIEVEARYSYLFGSPQ